MKSKSKKVVGVFSIVLFSILIISMASAGWFDGGWLKKIITGKATSQPFNVSVSLSGTSAAQITNVSLNGLSFNPNETNYTNISFSVNMYDPDGVNDLNDTSVNVTVNYSTESRTTGITGSCIWKNDVNTYNANYSCEITMWYWDINGTWSINAQGKDIGNGTWAYNDTATFNYGSLRALQLSPLLITWPTLIQGQTNQTSDNHPLVINNTGNFNGTIELNITDLIGETVTSVSLESKNFTAGNSTGGGAECVATALENSTWVPVAGAYANRGNLSLGGGAGQRNIYFCIPNVPNILAQTYSTVNSRSWITQYPL